MGEFFVPTRTLIGVKLLRMHFSTQWSPNSQFWRYSVMWQFSPVSLWSQNRVRDVRMSIIWCQGGWFWMIRESTKLARGRRGGRSVCTRRVEFLGHTWNCLPFFRVQYFLRTQPLLVVGWWQVCGGLSEVVARSSEGVTAAIILSECEDQRLWGCENNIVSVFSLLVMCNMRIRTVYFAEHTSTQMPLVMKQREFRFRESTPEWNERGETELSGPLFRRTILLELCNSVVYPAI